MQNDNIYNNLPEKIIKKCNILYVDRYFDDEQEYDVYDFAGNQITENKPDPKNHTY